jgi:hypothetical protein
MEPGAPQRHPVRGTRDDGLHLHRVREHQRLPVALQIGVARRLVLAHDRRGYDLDAPEPLYAHVAFPPGQEQAHGIEPGTP